MRRLTELSRWLGGPGLSDRTKVAVTPGAAVDSRFPTAIFGGSRGLAVSARKFYVRLSRTSLSRSLKARQETNRNFWKEEIRWRQKILRCSNFSGRTARA